VYQTYGTTARGLEFLMGYYGILDRAPKGGYRSRRDGNVRWGRLQRLGGPLTLTIFDLFFNAGGTESVRGYSQDALSAYSFFDAPLGGTKLFVGNVELRAPLFWRLSGVLFADAGNTFANAQPIRLSELGVGLGFGLRIKTPLAPIRIDVGFPRSFGENGVRWHFSIGQMF